MTDPRKTEGDENSWEHLLRFLGKWSGHFTPRETPEVKPPPRVERRISYKLIFLKTLPWFALGVFSISLFWDFQGILARDLFWRKSPLLLDGILRMLSVCALVGFATNWLAVKMLFYPRKKRPLLGQGLIPARKKRIVHRLGESISKEIVNSKLILQQIRGSGIIREHREHLSASFRAVIQEEEFRRDLLELFGHYLSSFLRSDEAQNKIREILKGIDTDGVSGLEGGFLKVYRFLKGDEDLAERIYKSLEGVSIRVEEYDEKLALYLEKIPDLLENKGEVLEEYALDALVFLIEQANIRQVIIDNLDRFDEIRLEKLLWRTTSDQLQYIQYLGCLLGFFGGLFIWEPVASIAVFGGLGLAIRGADELLYRMGKNKDG